MKTYFIILGIGLAVLTIGANWKIYEKAGFPGWTCLVPFYNIIVLLRIVGKPEWWIVFYLIPGVNAFVSIYVMFLLARSFGQDVAFVLGMAFLPFIFYPILGFGDSIYEGPAGLEYDEEE